MNNNVNKSYDGLTPVEAKDIPELVDECLDAKINLLIYGEPGCGKSSIIQGLSDKYNVVTLGCATLCEEALYGIPVYDAETKTTPYAMPDWLKRVLELVETSPKPVCILLDELTLANPIVMNGLQLLLTDRKLSTQPDYPLPDNVVIVAATNTVADTTEGVELSRPLKTRFATVRMMATPESFEEYAMEQIDAVLPHVKELLGEAMTQQFIRDAVHDLKEFWCDNTEFYGTNPRTIMNYFKACDSCVKRNNQLKPSDVNARARRTVGHEMHSFNWSCGYTTQSVKTTKNSLIPPIATIKAMDKSSLRNLRETIMNSTKATTAQGIRALMAIDDTINKLEGEDDA